MNPLLETRALRIAAGPNLLIDSLDWQVSSGEFWCVIGANGAGKTSLLNVCCGLASAQAGQIDLFGRALGDWPVGELARLRGWLPQQSDTAFGLTAMQLVLAGRHPHAGTNTWEQPADIRIAEQAMVRLDVQALAERELWTLSGGERQRVALACLLAQAPRLYLLDEPLTWLDLRRQLSTMQWLRDLADAEQQAVIAVIHDVSLAARFATHALILGQDSRSWAGPIDQVFNESILSAAMGCPMRRIEADGELAFVPAHAC